MPDTAPKTLSEALVALQAQLPRIPKSGEAQVGTRTYRYANLATITDLLMPIMAAVGLAFTCCPTMDVTTGSSSAISSCIPAVAT